MPSLAFAQTSSSPDAGNLEEVRLGLVQVLDVVELPAEEEGTLVGMSLHIGDNVASEAVVAKIDSELAELRLAVANAELAQAQRSAADESKLQKAQNAIEIATIEFEINDQLNDSQVVAALEFEKAKAALRQAEIEAAGEENALEILRDTVAIKEAELKLASHAVENRVLVCPFEGTVEEVLKHSGEWVRQGDGVIRIVRMDRLRVQAFIDPSVESPFEFQTAKLEVTAEIAPGLEPTFEVIGTPSFSPAVEADGQWVVWLEISNQRVDEQNAASQWLLRPGMPVSVRVVSTESTEREQQP